MSERTCKLCGKRYLMLVPYSKARKDIRDYCPACVKEIFDNAANGNHNASVCPTCSKQEDRQPEAPMGDA